MNVWLWFARLPLTGASAGAIAELGWLHQAGGKLAVPVRQPEPFSYTSLQSAMADVQEDPNRESGSECGFLAASFWLSPSSEGEGYTQSEEVTSVASNL